MKIEHLRIMVCEARETRHPLEKGGCGKERLLPAFTGGKLLSFYIEDENITTHLLPL